MKVKLSYTVDLDDVPDVIQEILVSIKQTLSYCASNITFNPNNLDKMVNNYQIIRKKLDVVDSQIEDILNITIGWTEAQLPRAEASDEENEEEGNDEKQI